MKKLVCVLLLGVIFTSCIDADNDSTKKEKSKMNLDIRLKKLIKMNKEEEALELLEEYVKNNPKDYDRKIEYAIYLSDSPFHDDIGALEIVDEIVKNNPTYTKALVVKAKMEDIHQVIKKETLALLNNFLENNSEDTEYYGEILLLKAFYFITFEKYIEAEEVLKKSIEVSPNFSWNYKSLGNIYKKKDDLVQAKYFYEMALDKVTKIYESNIYYSPYSVNEFIGEYIRATYTSDINYEGLVKKIDMLKRK